MFLLDILYFLIALGVIITIHEIGHLVVAKKVGIYCHEFCIGFGPKLFRFKKGETYYSLALLPIGGYVAMAGEEITVDDSNVAKDRRYDEKTVLERFLVAVAGVVMNFGLAFILFLIVVITTGTATEKSILGNIDSEYSAHKILEEGDEILEIGGIPVTSWSDIGVALYDDEVIGTRNVEIVVKRDGKEVTEIVNPRIAINSIGIADFNYDYFTHEDNEGSSIDDDFNKPYVGFVAEGSKAEGAEFKAWDLITSVNETEVSNWNEAIIAFADASNTSTESEIDVIVDRINDDGAIETVTLAVTPYINSVLNAAGVGAAGFTIGISPIYERTITGTIFGATNLVQTNSVMIFDMISLIFQRDNGVGANDLGGVVSIFNMTSQAAASGLVTFLLFMGMLSVNVAVLNLLPIPALDGGRIVFLGVEAIRKKKVKPEIENTVHGIFMLLLFMFMIYITIVDILRWT